VTRRQHVAPAHALAALALAAATIAAAPHARANPKKLPLSYAPISLPRGAVELESIVDVVPVPVERELDDGRLEAVLAPRYVLTTEWEYGLTDHLELGLYFVFRQGASADTPFLRFQGLKQRLRWRLTEPGQGPIDVGVYVEIAELHDEFELEQKLLLARRFGRFEVVGNLWVEQEWYYRTGETKFIYNPTLGATWELSPAVTLGGEYWVRGRFDESDAGDLTDADGEGSRGAKHYLGPTLMAQRGEAWLSLGAYLRLDGLADDIAVGDGYGRVWVRLILGIGL
jgi:hypothetical protein